VLDVEIHTPCLCQAVHCPQEKAGAIARTARTIATTKISFRKLLMFFSVLYS
jgi:hypothetical protein